MADPKRMPIKTKMHTHPHPNIYFLVCSSSSPVYLQFRNKSVGDEPGMIILNEISKMKGDASAESTDICISTLPKHGAWFRWESEMPSSPNPTV